jgi:hypothetical protein
VIAVAAPDAEVEADRTSDKDGVALGEGAGVAVEVTARFAVAAEFVEPCVLVSAPAAIVLAYVLADVLVTATEIVHDEFTAKLPPANPIAAAPAVAVSVALAQVVEAFAGDATFTPAGNVSVSAMPPSAAASELVFAIVINSCEVPDVEMEAGVNVCESPTLGAAVSVSEALAAVWFGSPPMISPFAGTVFTIAPGPPLDEAITAT